MVDFSLFLAINAVYFLDSPIQYDEKNRRCRPGIALTPNNLINRGQNRIKGNLITMFARLAKIFLSLVKNCRLPSNLYQHPKGDRHDHVNAEPEESVFRVHRGGWSCK